MNGIFSILAASKTKVVFSTKVHSLAVADAIEAVIPLFATECLMKHKALAATLLATVLYVAPATTQIMPITPDLGWSMSINAGYSILSNATIRESAKKRGHNLPVDPPRRNGSSQTTRSESRASPAVRTSFTPTGQGRGLDEMAAHYPTAERAEARRKMQQMYDQWPRMARQLGVPVNDMGSALAAYLVGSWMAYNNVNYSDDQFKLAAEQMRHILSEFPDFANLSNAERQVSHEQLVTLGMVVALTRHELQQNPNPAIQRQLRQLAGQNLRNFLKTDPSRVHFRSDGLMEIR